MNYKDRLKAHLRIKNTVIYICGAAVIACVILLLVFLKQEKTGSLIYLVAVAGASLVIIKPLSKAAKKDREQLKCYEDKEKAERKARARGQNPTNKFGAIGTNRTNALLGITTTNEQEEKKDEDPIGRFKYKK